MSRRSLALFALCGASFLAFLDTTIVNTSFPSIGESFEDASPAELSWILDGYFIVFAALLIPAGGIADRVGRRRVFLVGVAAFTLSSLLCAVAPTWEALIAARVLQGTAAAVIAPVSLALILGQYPAERRAAGIGVWGASAALAAACGPPLGGLLVEVADWRWIFLVNLPIGALVIAAGVRALDESRDEDATGLPDLLASALVAVGLALLALGIVEGNNWGWGSPRVIGAFAAAAVLVAVVARRCLTHPRPLVDPALMAIASFRRANLATLLFAAAFFSTILGNILFLTGVWGYDVLHAGLATIPGPLATTFASQPAGRLADRFGHRAVIVPGCLLYATGLLVLRSAGGEPDWAGTWLPGMVIQGIGVGLAFPTLGAAAAADIDEARFGVASAVTSAFRQFGAVLGTAILIAIVGQPTTLAAALAASDDAYLFGVGSVLGAAVVAGTIVTRRVLAPPHDPRTIAAGPPEAAIGV
ncbi:Drug efflux pump JefA [Paraconexibacter sp. AEG42_29]|uniref:Drug efflux pump JefA n=1 Tax=Paraconexibacter sp. AEG42_29 TaxID=2997339 RepID=A0AAU7AUP3_9ACTN